MKTMLWFCSISNVFPSFFHILLSNEIITISFLLRFIEITLRGILGYQTILKSHLVRDVVKADHILSSSRLSYILMIKNKISGLPWWRSGWESACQCRGHGFEPWSGRIPHAAERLGPWATIAEPARLETVLRNKRGRDRDRKSVV